jgi:hypothetical protein
VAERLPTRPVWSANSRRETAPVDEAPTPNSRRLSAPVDTTATPNSRRLSAPVDAEQPPDDGRTAAGCRQNSRRLSEEQPPAVGADRTYYGSYDLNVQGDRTAADAAPARARTRGKVFDGERLKVSGTERTPAPRASDLLGEGVDVVKRAGSNGADLQAGFDSFWFHFPRKVAKGEAWRAWQKLAPDAALLATMIASLHWQRRTDQWLRDGGRFTPYPASWLRQSRWLDEPSETPRVSERTLGLVRASEEFLKS